MSRTRACNRCFKGQPLTEFTPVKGHKVALVCNSCRGVKPKHICPRHALGMDYSTWNAFRQRCTYYGIKPLDFLARVDAQNGECSICKIYVGRKLCIDHCHKTGVVRGLICSRCNTALGMFRDDLELIRNAVSYLEDYTKPS